jgi:2-keto-3-deoxy-6-phosphogluconate aldolase
MSAIDAIRAARLVAILRRLADLDAQVGRLAAAGVLVVEITLDSDDALGAIERSRGSGDVTVLAGTVRVPAQVDAAVSAGADAIVSPVLSSAVLERAAALGTPAIPGALTPTEVETAWKAGAALVKLFPPASADRVTSATCSPRCPTSHWSRPAASTRRTRARSSTRAPSPSASARGSEATTTCVVFSMRSTRRRRRRRRRSPRP